ncbi:DinB family protein [Bacillus horti]|uniref:Damage-inducible protein DinB n=1 Tax=Caldalkalibacillus horti TaxID=77523 RepID=A0ABT9VYB4_9BACI|nr:DinB family protein [Bacillus horti]MDQ0165812.1 putative damage-inducible protein DinB [Bacillus horti]
MLEILRSHLKSQLVEMDNKLENILRDLNDEDVNWRENDASNSIANLIVHISGHVKQRIGHQISGEADVRDRDAEFDIQMFMGKKELMEISRVAFSEFAKVLDQLSENQLLHKQEVKAGQIMSNIELMLRCVIHYSEHIGQIIYIAKMLKANER